MTNSIAPMPLAEIDAVKRLGGQVTYNLAGERVVTYPDRAVEQRLAELASEMFD